MHDIFDDIAEMQKNIQPLFINNLHGRVLRISSSKPKPGKEILLVYGHHSSLERMYGIAEAFSQFGTVTMPDLPGFGGMDSFYKIGMKPTIDNLADYLATFVTLRYRRKRVTIVGMSFGFIVITRMLQRYPDLVKKVDILVSLVGFSHFSDFSFSKKLMFASRALSFTLARRPFAFLFYNVALHPLLIRTVYSRTPNAIHKFESLDEKTKQNMLDFEVILWRSNDARTHWNTAFDMLTVDNCKKQVALPIHNVSIVNDQYFDSAVVEQHMRVIYEDFIAYHATLPVHAPSIISKRAEAEPFIPAKLKKVLSK